MFCAVCRWQPKTGTKSHSNLVWLWFFYGILLFLVVWFLVARGTLIILMFFLFHYLHVYIFMMMPQTR